jgi:hypothetical protein
MHWSEDELAVLREWYPRIGAVQLQHRFFPDRTADGVMLKARRLELSSPRNWTAEQEELLEECYGHVHTVRHLLQAIPGKTPGAIRKKALSQNSVRCTRTLTASRRQSHIVLSHRK